LSVTLRNPEIDSVAQFKKICLRRKEVVIVTWNFGHSATEERQIYALARKSEYGSKQSMVMEVSLFDTDTSLKILCLIDKKRKEFEYFTTAQILEKYNAFKQDLAVIKGRLPRKRYGSNGFLKLNTIGNS